jgi:hypothetical protein
MAEMKLRGDKSPAGEGQSHFRLVSRFGPVNARAYFSIASAILTERLWRVPARANPSVGSGSAGRVGKPGSVGSLESLGNDPRADSEVSI